MLGCNVIVWSDLYCASAVNFEIFFAAIVVVFGDLLCVGGNQNVSLAFVWHSSASKLNGNSLLQTIGFAFILCKAQLRSVTKGQ